jgi:signal transduction histidine kinase
MAVVLAGLGAFLYLRFEQEVTETVDQGLRASADKVAVLVREAGFGLQEGAPEGALIEAEESFAQVLGENGRILDATPLVGAEPLLGPDELERAGQETVFLDRPPPPGLDARVRLLATPVQVQDQLLVVVVGASLDDRDDALSTLRSQLLVGGPVVLVLTSLLGYLLAGAALHPVESMRRRAAEISAAAPGRRLPVPPARDEISRLGETLNEMLERLETALLRERRFVADASHELRTPLALLKAELELALRRSRSPRELEAAVRSAAEETDRLSQLAEDLLLLARADQGVLPLHVSELDAGELLDRVAGRFRRRASDARRAITVDTEPRLVIAGDSLRLEQALANLAENALRHGDGEIHLSAHRRGALIELHVLDRGPGFPSNFLPRAFERFSRADEARGRGGAGLGLALVEAVASAHGGSAGAANRDSGGADVWLSLPLSSPSHPDRAK